MLNLGSLENYKYPLNPNEVLDTYIITKKKKRMEITAIVGVPTHNVDYVV